MSKVLIVEHDNGRCCLFIPSIVEYASKVKTKGKTPEKDVHYTEDEYLAEVETDYNEQGIITHGIVDESTVPPVPVGGNVNDMSWNGKKLVYGTKHAAVAKRKERDVALIESDMDYLVAMKNNDTTLMQQIVGYTQKLRDLGAAIDANPSKVKIPISPVPDNLRVKG